MMNKKLLSVILFLPFVLCGCSIISAAFSLVETIIKGVFGIVSRVPMPPPGVFF